MADVKASLQSPSQTVGPFFHDALIKEADRILINNATQGEKIILTGTVFDGDGVPVPDAMVEIWQADANGVFNHPDDHSLRGLWSSQLYKPQPLQHS